MNRLSDTHLLSSTRMRCITAICPAGPPKLSAATRSQTRKASPIETPWAGCSRPSRRDRASVSLMSGPLLVGRPIVRLADRVAAPTIERVVEYQPGFELFEIVGIHSRQAERGGKEARSFRRQIEPGGVRGANDRRQPQKRRRREIKLVDHHVEGAGLR